MSQIENTLGNLKLAETFIEKDTHIRLRLWSDYSGGFSWGSVTGPFSLQDYDFHEIESALYFSQEILKNARKYKLKQAAGK